VRRSCCITGILLLVVLLGAAGGLALVVRSQLAPVQSTQQSKLLFTVARGESLGEVADRLQTEGVVHNSFFFKLFAETRGLTRDLTVGRFRLDRGMTVGEVVDVLKGPPVSQAFNITIPDGLRVAQEADLLQIEGLFSAKSYLNVVDNPTNFPGISPLPGTPAGAGWEGLAFGDTYQVLPTVTPYQLVQKQLEDFGTRVRQAIVDKAASVGITPYQVVVLASIVSAEAATTHDRGLVSGVFFNRLHAGMPLQSDVTVLYAQSLAGDNGTTVNTSFTSPYNTYLHTGLPPGPIDSPGLTAIAAALNPIPSKYLYFLALPNGKVEYSVTLAQHNQQIQQAGLG
jgi:UPF0755 protein